MAQQYADAFGLPAWDAASLNQLYLDEHQPFAISTTFETIRDNVHRSRAVLQPHTFSKLNQFTQLDRFDVTCVCDVVDKCALVLSAEHSYIGYFYEFGSRIEHIDYLCRLHQSTQVDQEQITYLLDQLVQLGWSIDKQRWNKVCSHSDLNHLYDFNEYIEQRFEDCL